MITMHGGEGRVVLPRKTGVARVGIDTHLTLPDRAASQVKEIRWVREKVLVATFPPAEIDMMAAG